MPTWSELYRDNLDAAHSMLQQGLWRSAVSRAYFSAYCAVTGLLVADRRHGFRFSNGFANPPHKSLPGLIESDLPKAKYDIELRRKTATRVTTLRLARCAADYNPNAIVGETEATQALQLVRWIIRRMRVAS
jgi:hypothetical protein